MRRIVFIFLVILGLAMIVLSELFGTAGGAIFFS